jgi:hypothetical protein
VLSEKLAAFEESHNRRYQSCLREVAKPSAAWGEILYIIICEFVLTSLLISELKIHTHDNLKYKTFGEISKSSDIKMSPKTPL